MSTIESKLKLSPLKRLAAGAAFDCRDDWITRTRIPCAHGPRESRKLDFEPPSLAGSHPVRVKNVIVISSRDDWITRTRIPCAHGPRESRKLDFEPPGLAGSHPVRVKNVIVISSRDDWIRTSDPFVPNEVRYRTALHPERPKLV